MVIYGHDEAVAAWVLERIPHAHRFGPCVALGVASRCGKKLLAGVVYHDYHPHHSRIELSMAAESPLWARRENIIELLRYPFEVAKVYKVYTATPLDNVKALDVNLHIGFKREAVLAHHFGKDRHCVVCRLLKPDYDRMLRDDLPRKAAA